MSYADLLRRAVIVAVLLVAWAMAFVQVGAVERARLAMGMTGTAPALGLEALGVNPANLATQQHEGWQSACSPGRSGGERLPHLRLYSDYLTGIDTDSAGGQASVRRRQAGHPQCLRRRCRHRDGRCQRPAHRHRGRPRSAGAVAFSVTERVSPRSGFRARRSSSCSTETPRLDLHV